MMTERERHDGLLIKAYAMEGSEQAFHAVVTRHVNLVLATAERQVGDRSLAEEIPQDVFAVLAKKAPRLSGYETLAGWPWEGCPNWRTILWNSHLCYLKAAPSQSSPLAQGLQN